MSEKPSIALLLRLARETNSNLQNVHGAQQTSIGQLRELIEEKARLAAERDRLYKVIRQQGETIIRLIAAKEALLAAIGRQSVQSFGPSSMPPHVARYFGDN